MYGNANKENFPNVNDYRNPVIAEAMKLLGYVNRYNRGIARVQKELRENGNGDATFSVANITVFGVNVADAAFAADGQLDLDFANKTGDSNVASNVASNIASNIASKKRYSKEQMQRVILDSCQDYSSLEEIADRVGRSAQYIKNYYIARMIDEGLLERKYPMNHPNQQYRAKKAE